MAGAGRVLVRIQTVADIKITPLAAPIATVFCSDFMRTTLTLWA
jgi:hypothetical protein